MININNPEKITQTERRRRSESSLQVTFYSKHSSAACWRKKEQGHFCKVIELFDTHMHFSFSTSRGQHENKL